MKHTLTFCALMLAGAAFAQTYDGRIHKLIPMTDEPFGILPGESRLSPELHTNDIDSITFDVDAQTFTVHGGYNYILNDLKSATYDLELLRSFMFTYIFDGTMPSTCLDSRTLDLNSFMLMWRPVEGAAGYQIRYANTTKTIDDWDNSPYICGEVTVSAAATDTIIEHLAYNAYYQFAIRTLSSKGEGYHSEWSTRINFGLPQWNFLALMTQPRYLTPSVINITDIGLNEATVILNTKFDPSLYSEADAEEIRSHFEIVDNNFVMDKLKVSDLQTGKITYLPITASDIAAGYIHLTDLGDATNYTVTAYNSNIQCEWDAPYNSISFWTKIDSSTPIQVTSTDLGSVLSEYMDNSSHMANQAYYLEGGKTYTISSNLYLYKGVTIATNPDDLAIGKRAEVQFSSTGLSSVCNLFIGAVQQPGEMSDTLNIDPIIFEGIDFTVPDAVTYGGQNSSGMPLTPNYLINVQTTALPFNLESLDIKNCTFQGFIRGFIRNQGYGHNINRINVDNNVFYNCGYYDSNGRGYAWFNGAGIEDSNIFGDLNFTNNTIYDSPRRALIYDQNKSLAWPEDVKWNIRIENNTFINFSTRNSCYIFETRYMPAGSYISLQRNLFVLAADDADQRALNNCGADIRTNDFSFDVNYSVGCREQHLKNDGIFTANAFSSTKNSFGSYGTNNGTADDLIVKVGSTPLKATDLFTNPNPPYVAHDPANPNALDHVAPDNIFEALRYRQTPEVLNLEIYTLGIGDPRWRN